MPLYKRPGSPYWWVRVGRKTRRSTRTTDRKAAEEFEKVVTERLWRRHQLDDRGAVSWREASERWLKSSAKGRRRDREILGWLEDTAKIDDECVGDVAHPDAIQKIRELAAAEGWSPSTIDRVMGTLSAVLHACVEWRYLDHTPKVPMYRAPVDEPRWLTREEFGRLCKELPPHLELAARFAVHTLLRMRAMLQLTWDRVDVPGARAWIPRAHQKAGRTFVVPLSSEALRILEELRELAPEGPWVFQYEGRRYDDCNSRAFKKAVKRAGLEPLRWHDLRHTGASWAVQSGVTLPELMVLGDWRSYAMVLRYAHLAPSHAAAAAERVAQWAHSAPGSPVHRRDGKCREIRDVDGGAAGDRTPDLRIAKATGS